jgi:polar amino acid transport system substrate-binding protein
LKQAQRVNAENPNRAFDLLLAGRVDVVAGVRQALIANAAKLPGSRVLDERFMAIEQAMGMPHARPAGLKFLREFIEEVKASGLVDQALERAGIRGVVVAPPAVWKSKAWY